MLLPYPLLRWDPYLPQLLLDTLLAAGGIGMLSLLGDLSILRFSGKQFGKRLLVGGYFLLIGASSLIQNLASADRGTIRSPGHLLLFVLSMLMIGVGFHLNGDPSQIGDIIKILGARYIIGIALALAAYFILPLPLEYRQALVIVFLAPVASANPPFTAQMGSDFGLASAINSVSIIASIVLITTALVIML